MAHHPAAVPVPASDARRLLLHAQGLCDDPDAPVTTGSLLELIEGLGYVQIDSINVLERAHHLTLFSRTHEYRQNHLAVLHERQRSLFEHWTHDASLIPVRFFAQWHHRRKRFVDRKNTRLHAWMRTRLGKNPKRVLDHVLARIEREGPLQSRDFEHTPGSTSPWWGWKPAKAALEYLWWRGDLSVAARINFHKVYDLTSRVFPRHHDLPPPTEPKFIDWCCREALLRSGPATVREVADFFGALTLEEVQRWRDRAIKHGDVVAVSIESLDGSRPVPGMAVSDWRHRARRATEAVESLDGRVRLLSPFDPVIRNRQRARRLFNFDYTFEAFVPAPKRKYGYYVLPILRGETFIGRADLKHDRARQALIVQGLWLEPKVKETKKLRRETEDSLDRLASFIGAHRVVTPAAMRGK